MISMSDEEEFEFEFDDDDEEEEEEKPKKTSKKSSKKSSKNKKGPSKPKAKKVPLPDGVKRRLLKNMKDISRLKEELESANDEKDSFEKEFELLEDELEKLRSGKESMETELNQKIAMVNALEKKLDRSHKDFDNFKKRNKNELDRQVKMGSKKIILGVIDVLDNLDRALAEAKKNEWKSSVKHLVSGIESIKKGLLKVLEDNHVEIVDPMGETFDPKFHEAIEMMEDKSVPENTILNVDTKGYLIDGVVLRAAKVHVSKGGPSLKVDKKSKKKKSSDKDEKDSEVDDIEEIEEVDELDEALQDLDDLEE